MTRRREHGGWIIEVAPRAVGGGFRADIWLEDGQHRSIQAFHLRSTGVYATEADTIEAGFVLGEEWIDRNGPP